MIPLGVNNIDQAIEAARTRAEREGEARHSGEGQSGGPSGRIRVKIKELFNDYLRVRTFDGATEGTSDILAAKVLRHRHGLSIYPWLTSFTTVDTNTANVADASNSVQVKMTQPYLVDDQVWIRPAGAGGSGVGAAPDYIVDEEGRDWAVV